jgi:predicted Zn-dependent protease
MMTGCRARDGGFPIILSTHPDPGSREDAVRSMAAEWVARGFPSRRVEEEAFVAVVQGMPVGPNLRQGFIEGNTFHRPEGRFRFGVPRGWETEMEGRTLQMARGVVRRRRRTARVREEIAAALAF